jgi:mono/diheme cytochrome c family protein
MRRIFVLGAIAALCAASAPAQAADGQKLFLDNCAACHRPNGVGVPGAFPALAGSKLAVGDPKEPIGRVLNGKGGMPSFKTGLSDADVAAVLTYVRSSWGNKAKPIAATQVASIRGGGASSAKTALQAH